jgi:hypothetical protein
VQLGDCNDYCEVAFEESSAVFICKALCFDNERQPPAESAAVARVTSSNQASSLRGSSHVALVSDKGDHGVFESKFAEEESSCIAYGRPCRTTRECCSVYACGSYSPGGTRFYAF